MSILPDPTKTNPKAKAIYDKIDAIRGGHHYPGLYIALSNYPELAEAFSDLGEFLRFKSILPGKIREIAILMTSASLKVAFEWETHQANALEAGLTPHLMERILKNDCFKDEPLYAQIKKLVEVFLALEKVPQDLQDYLVQSLGMEAFIQLSVMINFYRMVSGLSIGFEFSLLKESQDPFLSPSSQ